MDEVKSGQGSPLETGFFYYVAPGAKLWVISKNAIHTQSADWIFLGDFLRSGYGCLGTEVGGLYQVDRNLLSWTQVSIDQHSGQPETKGNKHKIHGTVPSMLGGGH
jgi:hypothetical protein